MDERQELLLIIKWLRDHPDEYLGVLTCALLNDAYPAEDVHLPIAKKREIERYFHSGVLSWCSSCLNPVMVFADGVRIEWPSRERHHCKAVAPRYKSVAV